MKWLGFKPKDSSILFLCPVLSHYLLRFLSLSSLITDLYNKKHYLSTDSNVIKSGSLSLFFFKKKIFFKNTFFFKKKTSS